ncbi:peptidyl-tRNA hydrolase domain-containing protein 1 [Perkinsus olseni]|uniref:peptidyl-tRNA hydrolase n=1 Tax=Perkinsus olseni TaxID=32597 RepID=A0A7J6R3J2_PEROL|nr:peptidyl-tRNA hydrolase domain-containing protein 1 [Perkinsus olseni]KAF4752092.1 peptidyl-tRNA hydrolase domain-containing protein 1 [Perkinsus olseni]
MTDSTEASAVGDYLLQYIVVRKDLMKDKKVWNQGAIIAQACHASTAAIFETINDADTAKYLSDIDNMTKCILKADDEATLQQLSQELTTAKIAHKLWIEQPENIPTALATAPAYKSRVGAFFKNLKLLR